MKLKKWLFVGLVIIMSFGISSIALASEPATNAANENQPVNGCQLGADNQIVQGWQMFNLVQFAQFLVEDFSYPSYEIAYERANITFNFCDHNNDGFVCVMQQNLPNDASGRSTYWLAEDNHPFRSQ